MAISEEAGVIQVENQSHTQASVISVFNRIPYSLISREITGPVNDLLAELTEICKYYKIYSEGAGFTTEGTNGDYMPSQLKYKLSAMMVDKEARFLFSEPPTVTVKPKGNIGKPSKQQTDAITTMQDLVDSVLDANRFNQILIKAARDCFIGKRVAGLVNFNDRDGVSITFLQSTQFIYEYKMASQVLSKFVAYIVVHDSITLSERRIFMKRYYIEQQPDGTDAVFLDEALYDGGGRLIKVYNEHLRILLDKIPAVVFINGGLTGDIDGESEIEQLKDYESQYSKLANGDIDAERKSMNPIKYAIDMDSRSTKGLSSAAGSFWDLGSDQNLENSHTAIGVLESSMSYSGVLDTTLKRLHTTAFSQIDMPDISLESMTGTITSGKALKSVYWPLIVRCKEKMMMWGPCLRDLIDIIIQGALVYPTTVVGYIQDPLANTTYEITIEQNVPIPEDKIEEKTMNLSEVEAQVMSRKSYMQRWFGYTDDEAQAELEQIALERQMIEDSMMPPVDTMPYPDAEDSAIDNLSTNEDTSDDEESLTNNDSENVGNDRQESLEDAGDILTEP